MKSSKLVAGHISILLDDPVKGIAEGDEENVVLLLLTISMHIE